MTEEKVQRAAALAKREAAHPLLPSGARRAIEAIAEALEALAHEVEILKIRQGGGCGKVSDGKPCTMPAGAGCPDCTVSLHGFGGAD